ncbi:hypothetical protein GCM10011386_46550 [Parapedobacter defluvii]|uniref:Transposase n=1 Tax=Parapedobacter defluvii TaxID=2045106 RepID=A0ABQ1MXN6_9SPHI|nr:hypothetical protein GCM10011386_46550 [Parapedobacter defluvii]
MSFHSKIVCSQQPCGTCISCRTIEEANLGVNRLKKNPWKNSGIPTRFVIFMAIGMSWEGIPNELKLWFNLIKLK